MKLGLRRREAPDRSREDLQAKQALILALDADVSRQLTAAEAASSGITTRASILIAAAGLTSGLQSSSQLVTPVVFTVAAALVGLGLLLMRTANEVPILEAEKTFWNEPPVAAQRALLHWKHGVLREREASLHRRRVVLVIGFALVAISTSWELVTELSQISSRGGD